MKLFGLTLWGRFGITVERRFKTYLIYKLIGTSERIKYLGNFLPDRFGHVTMQLVTEHPGTIIFRCMKMQEDKQEGEGKIWVQASL